MRRPLVLGAAEHADAHQQQLALPHRQRVRVQDVAGDAAAQPVAGRVANEGDEDVRGSLAGAVRVEEAEVLDRSFEKLFPEGFARVTLIDSLVH